MRATRDPAGNLIVTNAETFLRVLLALCIVVAIGVWIGPVPTKTAIGWTAMCALFGLPLTAGNERASFVFDRATTTLRWRKDTPFRHQSGQIPFTAISALSIQRDFVDSGRSNARRLVLHTDAGVIPVTTAFTGVGKAAEQIGQEIRSYLLEATRGRELPFVKDA